MKLILRGRVSIRDDNPTRWYIGKTDLIQAIQKRFGYACEKRLTVGLSGGLYVGGLDLSEGHTGYSEWTPGSPAKLFVGPHNVLDVLSEMEGRDVTMWVSDKPINLLLVDGPEDEDTEEGE